MLAWEGMPINEWHCVDCVDEPPSWPFHPEIEVSEQVLAARRQARGRK